MLSFEVIPFLVGLSSLFVLGIPAVVRKTKMPVQLQFREYDDNELTPKQREFFAKNDAAFAEINYQPAKTFSVPNLTHANLCRCYYNSADPASACTMLIRVAEGAGANVQATEFVTVFTDGTKINTKNSPVSTGMFKKLPNYLVEAFPGVQSMAVLKKKHDERTAKLGLQPVFRNPGAYQQLMQEHHDHWAGHQAASGLLRLDASAGQYQATPLLGLRGVLNFLNPVVGDFTIMKFAAGVVLGAGVPLMASMYGPQMTRWMVTTAGTSFFSSYLAVMLASCVLAGISIGSMFQQRSFVWGFLLAYMAPSLIHMKTGYTFFGSMMIACIADWTAKAHRRRGRLL